MRADPRYTNPKPLPTPQKPGAQCGNYTICGTRFHPGAQGRGGVRRRSYPDIVGLYLLVIRLESVRIVRRGAVVLARLQWTQSVKHTRGGRRLFYPRRARPARPPRPRPTLASRSGMPTRHSFPIPAFYRGGGRARMVRAYVSDAHRVRIHRDVIEAVHCAAAPGRHPPRGGPAAGPSRFALATA